MTTATQLKAAAAEVRYAATVELTREDIARLPPETQVLMDLALERGKVKVWTKKALDRAMRKHCANVPQFPRLTEVEVHDNREFYVHAEQYAFAVNEDCELSEDFDMRQRFRPMANLPFRLHNGNTITLGNVVDGDTITVGGVTFSAPRSPSGRMALASELLSYGFISAVETARGRITISSPPSVRKSAGMADRRRLKRTPDPTAKPSRVPQLPKRRLDGRRA